MESHRIDFKDHASVMDHIEDAGLNFTTTKNDSEHAHIHLIKEIVETYEYVKKIGFQLSDNAENRISTK
ncbi:hypothetical protein QVD17_39774 [Tagetes erecta]|uniref:Uncharacterized protein n=1 Tax=Tagetes erecta TaxID=13708 RepID=A0AAD8JP61_TARER|nr:hypothetical protein QVD17_39774 [Tagetes erecta]